MKLIKYLGIICDEVFKYPSATPVVPSGNFVQDGPGLLTRIGKRVEVAEEVSFYVSEILDLTSEVFRTSQGVHICSKEFRAFS